MTLRKWDIWGLIRLKKFGNTPDFLIWKIQKKYTYRKCSKVETVIIEDGMFETDSLSSKIASKKNAR